MLRATVGGFDNRSWLVIVVSVAFVSERENVGLISRLSHGRIGESVCFPRSAVKLRKLVEGIENGRLFCGNSTRRRSLLRCWVNKLPAFDFSAGGDDWGSLQLGARSVCLVQDAG